MATMKKAMSGARTFLEHEGRRTLHEATRGEYGSLRDVDSVAFQLMTGTMIIFNTIVLGVEADHPELDVIWNFFDQFFLFFFIVELYMRLRHHGFCTFFCRAGDDLKWNYLDTFLVLLGITDIYLLPFILYEEQEMGRHHPVHETLRIMRLMRLLRMLRVFRLMRLKFVRQLMFFMTSFGKAATALLGGVGVFLTFAYVWAILITNLSKNHHTAETDQYFGSVGRTMNSLFIVITLDGWADIAREARVATGIPGMFQFFIFWIFVSFFVITSLLAGVVSEQMAHSESERETRFKTQREERLRTVMRDLRAMVKLVCANHAADRTITEDELEDFIEAIGDSHVGAVLYDEYHVEADVLRCLFDIGDIEGTRVVDIDDLLASLLRLVRNEPNCREMLVLQHEVRRLGWLLSNLMPATKMQTVPLDAAARKLLEHRFKVGPAEAEEELAYMEDEDE